MSVLSQLPLTTAFAARLRQPLGPHTRGRFRQDLYYWLNVLPVEIPALRYPAAGAPLHHQSLHTRGTALISGLSDGAAVPTGPAHGHAPLPDHRTRFRETVGRIELNILEQALRKTNGNKKQAADMLGLKRTTLAAKLKNLEVLAG